MGGRCSRHTHLAGRRVFCVERQQTNEVAFAAIRKRTADLNRSQRGGSSIDDFLKNEGIFDEAQAQAVKEVVAWQLAAAMKKKKISKNRMATLLKTSRTQVDRLLDPQNDITLGSLQRAAVIVGRRVTIQLV